MEEKYLIPQNDLLCWKNPQGSSLYYENHHKSFRTNQDGLTIVELCNGKRTVNDVVKILREEKTLNDEDIERIKNFMDKIVSENILQFSSKPAEEEIKFRITGDSNSFHPIHSTVELCDVCNLECAYCYREASPSRKIYLTKPIEFFSGLYEQGVRAVELSGGEPLLHPQIYDILEFACKTFDHVALLTNGVLLNTKILDLVENFKKKFSLQVSVPSMKKERFQKITGKDMWNRLRENLLLLKNRNILFRIGMVFCDDESIKEYREAAYFANTLGAKQFVANPFISLGRAKRLSISPKIYAALHLEIEALKKELPITFLGIFEGEILSTTTKNCGAGSRSIVFDPEGKLRPCPMFPTEKFSRFALRNSELRNKLSQIVSPRQSICGPCQFRAYCYGCILRGALKFKETKCTWGKSQDIESIFTSLKSDG